MILKKKGCWGESNFQVRILYLAKLSFKSEDKIKALSGIQTYTQVLTRKKKKKLLKDIFQQEEKLTKGNKQLWAKIKNIYVNTFN